MTEQHNDNKTRPSDQSIDDFIAGVPEAQRDDCHTLIGLMREVTGEEPRLWGGNIVGFGTYHYRYATGREGDWLVTGFSPRKQNTTVYLSYGFEQYGELLERLGKHKLGKACLYIKRLSDVDQGALRELVARAVADMRRMNPPLEA